MGQAVEGKVPVVPVPLGKSIQLVTEHIEFAGHGGPHDQFLGLVHQVTIGSPLSGKARIQRLHRLFLVRPDKQSIHQIEKVIAGGTGDGPAAGKLFAFTQDLLDQDE